MSGEQYDVSTPENRERKDYGMGVLEGVDGEAGDRLLEALGDVAPDMVHHVAAFAYGDIYARPGLTLREREMITVAALTAQGNAAPQLKSHIVGALNSGCTEQEIIEIMIQMAVYAGFPAAINGIMAAKEVFAARKANEADSD